MRLIDFFTIIGGIGSFGCLIIAFFQLPKITKSSRDEYLTGQEALHRYNEIKDKLAKELNMWESAWEGKAEPLDTMLIIEHHKFDPDNEGIEWKDCTLSIRYVYKNSENKYCVKGWRIKEDFIHRLLNLRY